jgi:antitoxin component of MazEF toxin-antitoxin module
MKVVRWGNSLAVRLPVKLVRELGLAEGDRIDSIRALAAMMLTAGKGTYLQGEGGSVLG